MSTSSAMTCRNLRLRLAPHCASDAPSGTMIRGDLVEGKMPNRITRFASPAFPALSRERLQGWLSGPCAYGGMSKEEWPVASFVTDAPW